MVFKSADAIEGQRLRNHLIRVHDVQEREFCGVLCFMEPNCVSYNLGKQPSGNGGTYTCELNNVTHNHKGFKEDLVRDQSYIFKGAKASANTNVSNAHCLPTKIMKYRDNPINLFQIML